MSWESAILVLGILRNYRKKLVPWRKMLVMGLTFLDVCISLRIKFLSKKGKLRGKKHMESCWVWFHNCVFIFVFFILNGRRLKPETWSNNATWLTLQNVENTLIVFFSESLPGAAPYLSRELQLKRKKRKTAKTSDPTKKKQTTTDTHGTS